MSEINIGTDKKEFRLKISHVKSHGNYRKWRILSFPSKIFKQVRNLYGEYSIDINDDGTYTLVLTPAWRKEWINGP